LVPTNERNCDAMPPLLAALADHELEGDQQEQLDATSTRA
jgi:hypothetical protein